MEPLIECSLEKRNRLRPARAVVNERRSEAIVLAGGLGIRLSPVVADRPKAMADIGGRPFLEILLSRLARNGIAKTILATGHLHELIERHFRNNWNGMEIRYSVEERSLGTGGAVRKALIMTAQEELFVLNGDTFFNVDLFALRNHHREIGADVTVALKPLQFCSRYGTVELENGRVTRFREKEKSDNGLINCGVYLINRNAMERFVFPEKFSLETDFLESKAQQMTIGAFVHDGYFIDIGIPEDYSRAQRELPHLQLPD